MRYAIIAAGVLGAGVLGAGLCGAARAQDGATSEPPKRIRSILLNGADKCPPSTNDEIVVCSSLEDPFRIPKNLRETRIRPQYQSWAVRAAALDEAGRRSSGLPDSCSPIGTGGQTGCTAELIRQWRAERRAAKQEAANAP